MKKTVVLTDAQVEWITRKVASGSYASDSEVIRDLVRREQEREAETARILRELVKGEQSGVIEIRDVEAFKREIMGDD